MKLYLKEIRRFTCRSFVLEGPREMVESAARTIEYLFPTTIRHYSMFDVTMGVWRTSLEIPLN